MDLTILAGDPAGPITTLRRAHPVPKITKSIAFQGSPVFRGLQARGGVHRGSGVRGASYRFVRFNEITKQTYSKRVRPRYYAANPPRLPVPAVEPNQFDPMRRDAMLATCVKRLWDILGLELNKKRI